MKLKTILLGILASYCLNSATHADFIKDSTANLYLKNFYFDRNFDDAHSKDLNNWSQSATFNLNSGYTDTPVQLGLDLSARYAYRLNSAKNIVDNIMPYDAVKQQQAQDQLKQKAIRAPFSGVMGIRQVHQGQYLEAGTGIANLVDFRQILAAGGIDTHIHWICPQQVETALMSGTTTMIGGGTGLATINTIKEQNLAQNAQQRGDFLQAELKKLAQEFPCIGNVRGRGLMIGIEIVDERKQADHMGSLPADSQLAAAIQTACFNNKLLLEKGGRSGTVIRLLCPLIITQEECEEAIARFKKAVAEALIAVRGA